jgi:hypothetical protein
MGCSIGPAYFFAAAFFAAQRFFRAATMAARPAPLSLRSGLFAPLGATDWPIATAHRLRCASAIALRPEALIPRFLRPAGFSSIRHIQNPILLTRPQRLKPSAQGPHAEASARL